MNDETRKAIDEAVARNNEHWQTHVDCEKKQWHESMWLSGILVAVTFFTLGAVIGPCIPNNSHNGREGESGGGWVER